MLSIALNLFPILFIREEHERDDEFASISRSMMRIPLPPPPHTKHFIALQYTNILEFGRLQVDTVTVELHFR